MTSEYKDLFSSQATDYSKFRPNYPDALFRYLSSLVDEHECAWDCGTGNGQAAVKLAEYFERVRATDPSAKQLESATQNHKVEYRLASAEKSGLDNNSIDLVTVAQAFHWFKQEAFFAEVQRVSKPRGVLAFWCYELAKITPAVDEVVNQLYKGTLGAYWEKERQLVDEGYKNVRLPFQEVTPPAFEMTAKWSIEHLIGYLGTWSALQTYIKKDGVNPLEAIYPRLKSAWGDVELLSVRWDLAVKVGRL